MNIAFLAHDKKKELMVQFCTAYKSVLIKHNLFATATTALNNMLTFYSFNTIFYFNELECTIGIIFCIICITFYIKTINYLLHR